MGGGETEGVKERGGEKLDTDGFAVTFFFFPLCVEEAPPPKNKRQGDGEKKPLHTGLHWDCIASFESGPWTINAFTRGLMWS